MSDVIEKAKKRLSEIEAEAQRLRIFIGVYADLSGSEILGNESATQDSDALGGETASPAEIVESARQAIKERERPLSRSMLVKILIQKGLKLPGQDAAKNIGTVIWRSKQFDNIAGWGYWPKDFQRWMGQRRVSEGTDEVASLI